MSSPIEATLILCDAAVGDPTGKLHILGAGWSVTSSPTPPSAVAVFMRVPWDRTNERLGLTLFLHDADGRRAEIDGQPIGIEHEFEVGRPAGVAPGTSIDNAFQLTLTSLPLPPGRYQWRLAISGEEFAISFQVRPNQN